MVITVRDAMKIGGLSRCEVVAGERGLDKYIEHITIMEVPDVIQWLKGRDLLLTSLYPIKDDHQAIVQLVSQLHNKGSAALAIKTNLFQGKIPEEILSEGNRLDFPIIKIYDDVAYLDILTPLMQKILNDYLSEYVNLEQFFKWVTELALGGKGMQSILAAIENLTGNLVTFETEIPQFASVLQVQGIQPLTNAQKNEIKVSRRSVNMQRFYEGVQIPCLVTPLILNDIVYGHVTCWRTKKEFREIDFLIFDRVTPLVALEFLKIKTKLDVEQNYKNDFLNDILSGSVVKSEEIVEKAKLFEWDFNQDFQVFVIELDDVVTGNKDLSEDAMFIQEFFRKLTNKTKSIFSYMNKKVIVGTRKSCVVVLCPMDNLSMPSRSRLQEIRQVADRVRLILSQEFDQTFSVGFGFNQPGVEGIYTGYQEAYCALELGRAVFKQNFLCHFNELRLYRILTKFHDPDELKSIYQETIGKLVAFDEENSSDLTETLSTYFNCNSSLTLTAKQLFVHVNTIKYRLRKIEELTECDVHNSEERLWLHTGLKIQKVLHIK